jgi:YigZ family protein
VLSSASAEIVIEKSRFIGQSFHVEDLEETENIIKEVKKKYYDATHNCFAYIMGEDMSIAKANDDGEPSSTAGKPMLEVMKKLNLTNTLLIATRYFGGIKLGASGLIRAYSKTAKIALDANSIVKKDVFNKIVLYIDYNLIGKMQKFLDNNQIIYDAPVFTEKVEFILYAKDEKIEDLQKDILDITNANCKLVIGDKLYLNFVDGKYLKN